MDTTTWIPLLYGHLHNMDASPLRTPPHLHLFFMDTSTTWTPLIYGHLHNMDTSPLWTPPQYGLLSIMDTSTIWTPLHYGHHNIILHLSIIMDTSTKWTPLLNGHLHNMDTSPLWTPTQYEHLSIMDTSTIWTPLHYGHLHNMDKSLLQTSPQYGHLSITYSSCGPVGTEIHILKFSICNTGTSKVQPVCCVPLMSVLKRFNCINYVLPNPCDTAPLSYSHLFSRSCFLFRFHPVEQPASKTIKDIFLKYNVYAVVQFYPWFKFCLLYSCVW